MKKTDLRFRVVNRLLDAGEKGLTKTELLQAMQVPADDMDLALRALADEFLITARTGAKRNLGRPARRYWHKDFAKSLTDFQADDIPTLEPGTSPPPGGTCAQCGSPTPIVLDSRPLDYCSSACRQQAKAGGPKIRDLFDRAPDMPTFAWVAVHLVMIDLYLRGFYVMRSPDLAGGSLMVADGKGGLWLTVVPISRVGYFPPLDEYDSAVAVYKDGRLKYGGKNPLVVEPEKIEDGEPLEKIK